MKSRLIAALFLGAATVTLGPVACKQIGGETATPTVGTELGVEKAWMDTTAKPGDDWYQYADGGWMKSTEIPADRAGVGAF